MPQLAAPVLVVGAGQGLLVAEMRKHGFVCDGVDLSHEMITQAKRRRDLDIFHANARSLPFGNAIYTTLIYATGVLDFMVDEQEPNGGLCTKTGCGW
jgi:predicted TPR repeat methyltransferase